MLLSMGSQIVRNDWVTSLSLSISMINFSWNILKNIVPKKHYNNSKSLTAILRERILTNRFLSIECTFGLTLKFHPHQSLDHISPLSEGSVHYTGWRKKSQNMPCIITVITDWLFTLKQSALLYKIYKFPSSIAL